MQLQNSVYSYAQRYSIDHNLQVKFNRNASMKNYAK